MVTKAKDFSSERFWDSEDLYQSRFLQIMAFAMKGFCNERLGQMDGPRPILTPRYLATVALSLGLSKV